MSATAPYPAYIVHAKKDSKPMPILTKGGLAALKAAVAPYLKMDK